MGDGGLNEGGDEAEAGVGRSRLRYIGSGLFRAACCALPSSLGAAVGFARMPSGLDGARLKTERAKIQHGMKFLFDVSFAEPGDP
jgi:hypothetical protein